MRKNYFFLCLLFLLLGACSSNQQSVSYTVTGELADSTFHGKKIFIYRFDDGKNLDSTIIEGNKFVFTGYIDTAAFCQINISRKFYANFILEGGNIKVDLKNPNMPSGTPMNEKMVKISNELDRFFQIIREKQVELQREYPKQDDFKTQYVSFYKAWKKDLIDRSFELFKEHNNDVIGEFLMRSGCFPYLSLEEQESLFFMFGDWLKSRRIVQMHIRRIESLKATAEGKMFVDIIGKDLNGKDIALADYVGKGDYVLMDFWASWCKPCREETPYLVKLYEQFKDKGLTIVGVFVSDKKENLKKVVEEENIGWPQLYDDKNMAMDLYGVNGIPHIILFAPDGTILKRDLRGNMMIETVTKLLTEK